MDLAGASKLPATPYKSCLTHSTARKKTASLSVIRGKEHFGAGREENQCQDTWLTNTPGASP